MQLTGAEILIRCLQEEGVDYVFGYPGGAVLNIYDELFKQNKVKHVLVRHEQGALHAADGYSRSSQKVGVALVTSGPGVTNAVTGIATAYMDSIPMVVITGQVPTNAIGQDAFQECDTVGITRPCVKHNFLVKDVRDLAVTIKKAFYLATTGRPGPVLVDIPKDVSQALAEYSYPKTVTLRSYNPVTKGHAGQIKKAVQLLLEAKRPMVYTGGGVVLNDAAESADAAGPSARLPLHQHADGPGRLPRYGPAVHRHARACTAPTKSTWRCRIATCCSPSARASTIASSAIRRISYRADRKIIHIDIDPSSISKRVKVDVPDRRLRVATCSTSWSKHRRIVAGSGPTAAPLKSWWAQIKEWQRKDCLRYDRDSKLIKPQFVVEKLYEITGATPSSPPTSGQHQMWAAQFYKFDKPRRWINSGGLGTMGFGLPAAMGVAARQSGRAASSA